MSSTAKYSPSKIFLRSLTDKYTVTLLWETDPAYLSLGIMAGVEVPNIGTKAQADESAWKRLEWLQDRSNVQDLVRSTVKKVTNGDSSWQDSVMDLSRDVYQLGSMIRTGNHEQSNTAAHECKVWKDLEEQARILEQDRDLFLRSLGSLVGDTNLSAQSVQKCLTSGDNRLARLRELSSMSIAELEHSSNLMKTVTDFETSLINTASSLLSHRDEHFAPSKQTEASAA